MLFISWKAAAENEFRKNCVQVETPIVVKNDSFPECWEKIDRRLKDVEENVGSDVNLHG